MELQMATITKRKSGWNVQVRRKGYAPRSKTFKTKPEAQAWARQQEVAMDTKVLPQTQAPLKHTTLGELLDRYRREVTPKKRGKLAEDCRLRRLGREPIADLQLASLTPLHLGAYRDRRLQSVKPATVRKELYLIGSAIDVATKEWGLPFPSNPMRQIAVPVANDARDRRLEVGELERLRRAIAACRNRLMGSIVELAIETGLRRGELLNLTWGNIDLTRRVAFIPLTKTGTPRTIPLTGRAVDIIKSVPNEDERLFPISPTAVRLAWVRICQRAGLANFRFHDLRHEALSRFCELGLSVPELSVISGHKDPRMLFRYAHLRADDLAKKLAGLKQRGR
jgi:integrase